MIVEDVKKVAEEGKADAKYEWEYDEFDDEVDPDSLSLSSHS